LDLSYAVVRGDPPMVFAAEDPDVLQKVIALEVVANTSPAGLDGEVVESLREALLDERWGDAVVRWMQAVGTVVDVYPAGLRVWTASNVSSDVFGVRVQFTPLFAD
jgi:hypothetical protein